MDICYKTDENEDNKYENYSTFMRESCYASSNPEANKKIIVTPEDDKQIEKIIALLFSEGDELVEESIVKLTDLIGENFDLLNQSKAFCLEKKNLPDRFLKLLNNYLGSTLLLLRILLPKLSDFDDDMIKRGVAKILAKKFDSLLISDNDTCIIANILYVSIKLSRKREFCKKLFETNFFENLLSLFQANKFDEGGESINEIIVSLILQTSKHANLLPLEIKHISNIIPLFLESKEIPIINAGIEILSKISEQDDTTVKNILNDRIICNLISFISNETEFDFLIKTLTELSLFASIGEQIINAMNKYDCLKCISQLDDFYKDDKLILCIFDLLKFWMIQPNDGKEMIFLFLKCIDFIYIFNNLSFLAKKKAIRILRLAISTDFELQTCQMIDILNFDLFNNILDQIIDSDDSDFSYDGCFLIWGLKDQLRETQFCEKLRECLMIQEFGQYLESVIESGEGDRIKIANDLLSFIDEGKNK